MGSSDEEMDFSNKKNYIADSDQSEETDFSKECIMNTVDKHLNDKKNDIISELHDTSSDTEDEIEKSTSLDQNTELQFVDTDEKTNLKSNKSTKKMIQKDLKDVHKETQRIMREGNISIPYHRPKQRTLDEFRNRRKTTPAISLHTSVDELATVWKEIEEREKLAEDFYKSESSDDESIIEENERSSLAEDENAGVSCSSPLKNVRSDSKEDIPSCSSKPAEFELSRDGVAMLRDNLSEQSQSIQSNEIGSNVQAINNTKNGGNNTKLQECFSDLSEVVKQDNKTIKSYEITDDKYTTSEKNILLDSNIRSNNFNSPSDHAKVSNIDEEEFSLSLSESQHAYKNLKTLEMVKYNEHENCLSKLNSEAHDECGGDKVYLNSIIEKVPLIEIENTNIFKDKNICSETAGMFESDNNLSDYKNSLSNQLSPKKKSSLSNISNNDKVMNDGSTTKEFGTNNCLNLPETDIPKLHSSQKIIDLDVDIVKPKFDNLIKRFYNHLTYKTKNVKKETPLQLRIISGDQTMNGHDCSLNEEIVPVLLSTTDNEDNPHLNKPGAKLAQLKNQLKSKMTRQREEEWVKKQKDQSLYEDEIYEENCDFEDDEQMSNEGKDGRHGSDSIDSDSTDKEDEEENIDEKGTKTVEKGDGMNVLTDDKTVDSDSSNTDEEEDEEIIGDVKKTLEKRSKRNVFIDDEAEEDSDEDEELPSFQKPLPPEEKGEELEESDHSSTCTSPAFRLTALEGKDKTSTFNWSEPSTPSKEVLRSKSVTPVRKLAQLVDRSPFANSQDLENLCSGQFVSQPTGPIEDNMSQDYNLFLDDFQTSQDQSPETRLKSPGKSQEKSQSKLGDSDNLPQNAKNRKVKKLTFSDDEVSDDDEETNSNKLASTVKNNTINKEEYLNNLDYDSEENEVIKEAGDFLENEAELSESDWDSEDEDEHGLDALEMEEADKEQIDEKKLKQKLNQIHMKQLLIEDKKEVRILQEMLLEDGELHSDGKRQRLFRWSNNAFNEDNSTALHDSDEDKTEEDDDEEMWRRSRHEREQFLREHSKTLEKQELVIEEPDSTLQTLGQKAVKRMNTVEQKTMAPNPLDTQLNGQPSINCGSFLTRGQKVLSRLAQVAANESKTTINKTKNTRNFVFTSVSPSKDSEQEVVLPQEGRKRKMPILPLPVSKKVCIQKPRVGNKNSLFDALFKGHSG